VTRALRFLGLGSRCLEPLLTDSDSRTVPHTLEEALRQSEDPTIVVCACAAQLTTGLAALPGVDMVAPPTLNQGLVRFLDCRPNATAADHDARTDWAIEAINREGTAFFSGTTWKGHRAMRISVVNGRTCARDVERMLKAVAAVLASDHMK
jgi:glutamate/tyrosine decarboxylase-like PLP-dependent enzyme